jgi:t-SNARE complex subunit (syntaxin)
MSESKTIEEKLSDITEMLARIEERQIAASGRVDQLETEMRGVQKQVNLAHGGIVVFGVLGAIIAFFKSVFSNP